MKQAVGIFEQPTRPYATHVPRAPFTSEVDPADAIPISWHLLGAGGYLEAWTDESERTALREAYFAAAESTEHRLVLLRESGRPCGMVQATQRANGIMVLHQMALDRTLRSATHSGSLCSYWILQTLFRAIAERPGHFQVFAESARSLSRSIYLAFHAKGWSPWMSDLKLVEVYRATPALDLRDCAHTTNRIEVADPTDIERSLLVEELSHRIAPIERDGALAHQWSQVARLRGRPAAGLVLEEGPQLNVFGVMNICSVVWLAPLDEADKNEVARALLAAALDRLRTRGVVAALLTHPDRELDAVAADVGFRHVSTGLRWTASTEIIPDYLRHLDETMVVRDTRG